MDSEPAALPISVVHREGRQVHLRVLPLLGLAIGYCLGFRCIFCHKLIKILKLTKF